MNRQELILRDIACGYIDGRKSFTQLEISERLDVSLSTVNNAITNLKEINALLVKQRSFDVIALDRLLLYWATHRSLKKDIVYQTRAAMGVKEIERNMPDRVAFTGYTGYKFTFNEAPADYSEVYLYATADSLKEIKRRFEPDGKIPNITVFCADEYLEKAIVEKKLKHSSVCLAQLFVDIWNMREWYAKEFTDALSRRLMI